MSEHYTSDVVVIGSGIAGALVAKQLARKHLNVIILEAGESWFRGQAHQRYQQSVTRDLSSPYKQPDWLASPAQASYFNKQAYQPSFLKGVGGTTWHWTAITPRFLPADFELYTRYQIGKDWPIKYDELEEYYVKAEYHMGVAGDSLHDHGSPRSQAYPMRPIPMSYGDKIIAKYLKKENIHVAPLPAARNSEDYDGRPSCKGNNTCTPLCPIGAAYSADIDIKKAIHAGANLIQHAVAYHFDINEQSNITAVHYKHPDGSSHQIKTKYLVVACNSIETPRLLLLANRDDYPSGIANSSGQLGRNLMDHTIFLQKFKMPEPLYLGRGPQSISTILVGRDGTFRKEYAAAKFFLGNDLNIQNISTNMLNHKNKWNHILENIKTAAIHEGQIGAEIEQLPQESNRITLDTNRLDPLGFALPKIHYQLSDYTQAGLEHWQQYTDKLIKKLSATKTEVSVSLSSHHPCGTTIMGNNPDTSVVNKNCQSHDHSNLFIAGSSVFPAIGTANPTLTIAALSLRLADYIIQRIETNY